MRINGRVSGQREVNHGGDVRHVDPASRDIRARDAAEQPELETRRQAMLDDGTHAVAETELLMSLTRREGRLTVERWLAEGRVARESLRFALPPSRMDIAAGDVVSLPSKAGRVLARIDSVEIGTQQIVDAVRIEPDVYLPSDFPDDSPTLRGFVPAVEVLPLFLDLPLMTGDETEHAPHLALTADPWPGTVAVYDAGSDEGYVLNEIIAARAAIGVTETASSVRRSSGARNIGQARFEGVARVIIPRKKNAGQTV